MEGILQSCRESLEGLRMAEVNVLPIRVSKDRVEQHVIERLAADGDLQRIHHDEIECNHVTRMMHLRERDFLFDTMLQLPPLHTPFEGAANRVGDANVTFFTGGRVVLLLEPIQNRVRFQSSILFEEFNDLAPELLQRIAGASDTYEPVVRS